MMSDRPIDPHSFSMGFHRNRRIKKNPGTKEQTTSRPNNNADWAASMVDLNYASTERSCGTFFNLFCRCSSISPVRGGGGWRISFRRRLNCSPVRGGGG